MVLRKTPAAITGVIPLITSSIRILEETEWVFYHNISSEQV